MIENPDFWAILISIFGGFGSTFAVLWDIRKKVCENSERITKQEAKMETEFAKCSIHCRRREVYTE